MAKTDEQVMSLVEKELEKNPGISVDDLFEKAAAQHPSVRKLTKRQFNARYPLQVKRKKSAASGGGAKTGRRTRRNPRRGAGEGSRETIRQSFLRFASDLAAAEERKDLVKVLAGVDKYVDEVMKAKA